MFLSILTQIIHGDNVNRPEITKYFYQPGILEIFTSIEKNLHAQPVKISCRRIDSSTFNLSRKTINFAYQREIVKLSRYKVEDPLVPSPSTWKLATIAPNAHPRENAEFTVRLIGDSTPSNHTE